MYWHAFTVFPTGHASMYGDGHYTSFDGKKYHYSGKCRYAFVKTLNDDSFSVVIDKAVCKHKNCHMIIYVTYKGNQINLIGEDGSFKVFVNRRKVAVPYVSERGFDIMLASSVFIKFQTNNGIQFIWDGATRMSIKVPPTLSGKLSGLAGNFNGKSIDDFATPNGDISHSPINFGNSWQIQNTNCSFVSKDYRMTSCESNHQVGKFAEEHCSIVLSEDYADCHRVVDPQPYYENCKEDVCACNGRKDCLCSVLSAFFRKCALARYTYNNWRNVSGCGK